MDFLKGASGTELVFWAFAVFGTLFFFLRVLAMVVCGFGAEDVDAADLDADLDADVDGAPHGSHHATGSDVAFKLFSIQALTGFIMMFGWVGLAGYKQFHIGAFLSFVIAASAGLVTMYLTAYLFKFALELTTRKAPFSVKDIVGKDAKVYQKIPKEGRGKIQIAFEGVTREIEAVSDDQKDIESFKTVRIVRAMDARCVAVKQKE